MCTIALLFWSEPRANPHSASSPFQRALFVKFFQVFLCAGGYRNENTPPSRSSSVAPSRLPLLEKCVHPFRGVLQHQIAGHRLACDVVGGFERPIDLAVERLLTQSDRSSTPR